MQNPIVSIVIPVYRTEDFLEPKHIKPKRTRNQLKKLKKLTTRKWGVSNAYKAKKTGNC